MADNVLTGEQRRRIAAGRIWALIKAMAPTTLIFLLVGPLAGYLAIMLPIALTAIDGPLGAVQGFAAAIAFLPFGGLFAYAMGYVPALVTGICVAAADCILDLGDYRTPAAMAAGSGITIFLLLTVVGTDSAPELGTSGLGAIGGAVGAIAAGVCAMIASRRVPSFPSA